MSDPFLAEIRILPFNFPPKGWAWCDGQLLPISQNTALFSLVGTTYGGNGTSNFALPNLKGRVPIHQGQGSGLSTYNLGETGGAENVTLSQDELPAHSHALGASYGAGTDPNPANELVAQGTGVSLWSTNDADATLSNQAVGAIGGGSWHNNLQPYLTTYFNISLAGVIPPHG
jgi:microcystin-dependent protein